MKKIAVYFDAPGWNDYPFDDPEYVHAYGVLAQTMVKQGADFFIMRSSDTYKGTQTFSHGWKFENGKFTKQHGPIRCDLIFVRGKNLQTSVTDNVINKQTLMDLCTDKMKTYL